MLLKWKWSHTVVTYGLPRAHVTLETSHPVAECGSQADRDMPLTSRITGFMPRRVRSTIFSKIQYTYVVRRTDYIYRVCEPSLCSPSIRCRVATELYAIHRTQNNCQAHRGTGDLRECRHTLSNGSNSHRDRAVLPNHVKTSLPSVRQVQQPPSRLTTFNPS